MDIASAYDWFARDSMQAAEQSAAEPWPRTAENARVIAQAEERQRAREEREAAEAKEANQVA
jgi:hypothetical protein